MDDYEEQPLIGKNQMIVLFLSTIVLSLAIFGVTSGIISTENSVDKDNVNRELQNLDYYIFMLNYTALDHYAIYFDGMYFSNITGYNRESYMDGVYDILEIQEKTAELKDQLSSAKSLLESGRVEEAKKSIDEIKSELIKTHLSLSSEQNEYHLETKNSYDESLRRTIVCRYVMINLTSPKCENGKFSFDLKNSGQSPFSLDNVSIFFAKNITGREIDQLRDFHNDVSTNLGFIVPGETRHIEMKSNITGQITSFSINTNCDYYRFGTDYKRYLTSKINMAQGYPYTENVHLEYVEDLGTC
jgi:hypothetical protein